MSTTRFTNGVTNVASTDPLGQYLNPSPLKAAQLFVDFTGLDYLASAWTVTETQAGATQALVAADLQGEYGVLAMVNSAGATDLNSIQLTTLPYFISDTTKKWWLRGRISRSNADAGMAFGMQTTNATPFTLVDGIWISVAAAATAAVFSISKNSTASTATQAAAYPTSALNTFIDLGMAYNGNGVTSCYVDGNLVGKITSIANFPDDVALTPTISTLNSTANARTMHQDYFLFGVER
jgi:hypothetical protein